MDPSGGMNHSVNPLSGATPRLGIVDITDREITRAFNRSDGLTCRSNDLMAISAKGFEERLANKAVGAGQENLQRSPSPVKAVRDTAWHTKKPSSPP